MIRHLILLKIKKSDGYLRGLASIVYNFFVKKFAAPRATKSATRKEKGINFDPISDN